MENTVLCGANSYKQKYYLNPKFDMLPQSIKDELKVLCTMYTENCGGIITLEFDIYGNLNIKTMVDDSDFYFDEIESGLMISKYQKEKEELFESLELSYSTLIK